MRFFGSLLLLQYPDVIIKLCSMTYKSKSKEVACCCIRIVRDTDAEEKEEEFRIIHPNPIPKNDSNKINSASSSI